MLRKIIVLYNLPGTSSTQDIVEADEDTRTSAQQVVEALNKQGYMASELGIDKENIVGLKNLRTDLVFNLIEWSGNDCEYGVEVIEMLEKTGIPYTGSEAWGYGLSCNKILMKKVMDKCKIPTPAWQVFKTGKEKVKALPYPVIVKPVYEHCGIGISQLSICENEKMLKIKIAELKSKYRQPVLAEEFVDGDEAQVTVLEKAGRPWVLPPAVFTYAKKPHYWPIMTYEAKWGDGWEAKMAHWVEGGFDQTEELMRMAARGCFVKLGGRDCARVDMRIKNGVVYVLEINNNPGMGNDPEAGIIYSATKAGMSYGELMGHIVKNAYFRCGGETYDAAIV